jgi:hypothetical protein
MTSAPRWHPDLLRRFVATPYVFRKGAGASQICIESNDLELALSVRQSSIIQLTGARVKGIFYRLIRDMSGPMDSSEAVIISDGALRTLHVGRGTILIYDRERSELLGFISSNVKAQELVSSLLPMLLSAQQEEQADSTAFTKK